MHASELASSLMTGPAVKLTLAQVVSKVSGRVTLNFGGANVPGVPYLSHLSPQPGQLVQVLGTGRQYLVIGSPSDAATGYVGLPLLAGFTVPAWAHVPSYSVVGDRVFLAGAIEKTNGYATSSTHVANIPPEARPPAGKACSMACATSSTAGPYSARVEFNGDGRVLVWLSVTGITWIGLDGLSYRLR